MAKQPAFRKRDTAGGRWLMTRPVVASSTPAAGVRSWHLYFDGKLDELVGHLCDWHRSVGQSFHCPDEQADGQCAHVQTSRCACSPPRPCDWCV